LRILILPENRGKGAAVLHGIREAMRAGFTHALTMDSDGQHPPEKIPAFMQASLLARMPWCWNPVFDSSAPNLRSRAENLQLWANLETLWSGIGDSLYGFRVYLWQPSTESCATTLDARFDFDVEAVVRLCWRGVPRSIYRTRALFPSRRRRVSHFDYWRDNALLTWMHFRLFLGFLVRLPLLLARRFARAVLGNTLRLRFAARRRTRRRQSPHDDAWARAGLDRVQ